MCVWGLQSLAQGTMTSDSLGWGPSVLPFFGTTMKIGFEQFQYASARPFGCYVLMYPSQSHSRTLCFC